MSSGYGAVQDYHARSDVTEMCDEISSNILQINSKGSIIDNAMKVLGSDLHCGYTQDIVHSASQQTKQMIKDTTLLIRRATMASRIRQHRILMERLTNDLQESISRFHSIQEKAMKKLKASVSSKVLCDEPEPLVKLSSNQQLQQIGDVDELAFVHDREKRMRELESDIVDVNGILQQLGALVHEQGESLGDIEANVERTYSDATSGREELLKAEIYQRKSRKKKCCIMIILFFVLAVVVIIIVVAVKK